MKSQKMPQTDEQIERCFQECHDEMARVLQEISKTASVDDLSQSVSKMFKLMDKRRKLWLRNWKRNRTIEHATSKGIS